MTYQWANESPRPGGHRNEGEASKNQETQEAMHQDTPETAGKAGAKFDYFAWQRALRGIPSATIGPAQKLVLLMAGTHADGRTGKGVYPSFDTLAYEADVSRPTVVKAMHRGEALGFVHLVKRGTNTGGQNLSNEYRLTIPSTADLESMRSEVRAKHDAQREKHNAKRRKNVRTDNPDESPEGVDTSVDGENGMNSVPTCTNSVSTRSNSVPTCTNSDGSYQPLIYPLSTHSSKVSAASSVSVATGAPTDANADDDSKEGKEDMDMLERIDRVEDPDALDLLDSVLRGDVTVTVPDDLNGLPWPDLDELDHEVPPAGPPEFLDDQQHPEPAEGPQEPAQDVSEAPAQTLARYRAASTTTPTTAQGAPPQLEGLFAGKLGMPA